MDAWINQRIKKETYTRRVLALVAANPGITVREITEASRIAREPVKSALNRLKTSGEVRVVVKEFAHQKPRMIGYYYAND